MAPADVPLKDQQETLPSHPQLLVVLLTGPDPAPPPGSGGFPHPCHRPPSKPRVDSFTLFSEDPRLAAGAPAAASPGSHWRPGPGPPPPGSPLHLPLGPSSPQRPGCCSRAHGRTPAWPFSCAAAWGCPSDPAACPVPSRHLSTGLSPAPADPRDPLPLGVNRVVPRLLAVGPSPVLTVLSSRLAEPGWAVAHPEQPPCPQGGLSAPCCCLLFLGELLSHFRYMPCLPFCVFAFCLTFAQAFSISIKALNTPFCTLFLCFARSSCGCSAARSLARGPRPPGAGVSGQCRTPSHRKTGGDHALPRMLITILNRAGWKSVSGLPPFLPAGHTGSCRPRGLTGTALRVGRQPLGGQGGFSVGSLVGHPRPEPPEGHRRVNGRSK